MIKMKLPIPIHKLALLQAYLYQVFTLENHCENSFDHTKWYLDEKCSETEIKNTIEFFKQIGLKCDCDIINKFNLKDFFEEEFHFHN
jgi:hypothetical protein